MTTALPKPCPRLCSLCTCLAAPLSIFSRVEVAPPPHVDLYARAVPQADIHRLAHREHQLYGDLKEVAATIWLLEA